MNEEIVNIGSVQKVLPMPVKILAVWNYILAAFTWISAVVFVIQGSVGANILGFFAGLFTQNSYIATSVSTLGSSIFIIVGFLTIILGFIPFFIARGLFRIKNWARILTIVFSFLGALGSLSKAVNGEYLSVLFLAIYLLVAFYLIFSKSVKETFNK